MSNIQIINTKEDFIEIIKNNELVLVNCGLTFCAPCKRIAPDYEKLSKEYPSVVFCKITLNDLDDSIEEYFINYLNLTKYPSFTLIHNGNNIEHIIGPHLDKIKNLLESMTGTDDF